MSESSPGADPRTSTAQLDPPWGGMRVALLRVLPVGAGQAQSVLLDRQELVIGREGHIPGPLAALADAEISRRHASVAPEADG
jgi:hypothetical protein